MAATAPVATPVMPAAIRNAILAWYDARGRSLPFRGTTDPYAVLVSEVMAQQTQISRVAAAWSAFMAAFPTIGDLAAASPADVLRAWRGMGYNRRALNLWRAARIVVSEHAGRLPADVAGLERLPGIGPYTARAVAAIAFGSAVGAVDTNVRRVLGRTVGGAIDAYSARELQRLADIVVPANRPADWTHALMDVGATFCRTTRPRCAECPAVDWCLYAAISAKEGHRTARRPSNGKRFSASSRWLRGTILDRLRSAEGHDWVRLDAPVGTHDQPAVDEALRSMAAEGLLELALTDPRLARLPIA